MSRTVLIIGGVVVAIGAVVLIERRKATTPAATPVDTEPVIIAQPSNADTESGTFTSGLVNLINQNQVNLTGATVTTNPSNADTFQTSPTTYQTSAVAGFLPGSTNKNTIQVRSPQ